jgi:type VI protein secretion system component Hcp
MTKPRQSKAAQVRATELNLDDLERVVGGKGKATVTVSDLHITKHVDKSSPILFMN